MTIICGSFCRKKLSSLRFSLGKFSTRSIIYLKLQLGCMQFHNHLLHYFWTRHSTKQQQWQQQKRRKTCLFTRSVCVCVCARQNRKSSERYSRKQRKKTLFAFLVFSSSRFESGSGRNDINEKKKKLNSVWLCVCVRLARGLFWLAKDTRPCQKQLEQQQPKGIERKWTLGVRANQAPALKMVSWEGFPSEQQCVCGGSSSFNWAIVSRS